MTTPAPNMGSSPAPPWAGPPGAPPPPGALPGPPGMPRHVQSFANHAMPQPLPDLSPFVQRPNVNAPFLPYPQQQGPWLQPPPQMGVAPRMQQHSLYHHHNHNHNHNQNQNLNPNHLNHHHVPAAVPSFPGPSPLMVRPMQAPPESHPPGVESQSSGDLVLAQEAGNQVAAVVNEQPDSWTAHRAETGVLYYYNTLTGESTYDKPSSFRGEPEKVAVQPVPVSMVSLPGTDWVLVSTSDGKKYYYNNKTKVSSWQVPNEVTELRKRQESDNIKEQPMSVPDTNVVTEKGSTPVSLNAPAINTGGRDAMALRLSNAQGSPSALDLIKKKLQDPGMPATSSSSPLQSGTTVSDSNGSRAFDTATKGQQTEDSKEKTKDADGDGNATDSSSDSEDVDSGPTTEECIIQFKEMLKERGVAPFSKWEKELPKIVFDPRFKAIPSYSTRRSLFEHYVKTRVEEERKEKRAAQKAAIEGFKQLLDEASEDINPKTDYQSFRKKWGEDSRFVAIDRKDRENLLNERVLPLKRAAEEKAQALRSAVTTSFKSMLREKGDITKNSRWSRVKDGFRDDPRCKSVSHEDREALFNEYLSDLRAAEDELEKEANAKRDEMEKLKERERESRKRKEREEQEMERVRIKVRRKEAVASFQALLVETIKDPQASWTETKPKLEKDPQGRASNNDLDLSEMEKLFRDHVKMLLDRCARDFKSLLMEVLTVGTASQETDDGKTILNSWSTAKKLLKPDPRYNKMPRKDRETLWRRYSEDMLRKQKSEAEPKEDKKLNPRHR